jgi:ABC-type transporter Mla subunit MlaD
LADAIPQVKTKLDTVLQRLTTTHESLLKTADNLNRLTSDGGDIQVAVAQFRQFGVQLNEMSGPDSPLRKSFQNIESLTGPDSKLALTLDHTEEFTSKLAKNSDLDATLANLRKASDKMNRMMADAAPRISVIATNLEQASDTVKHQPWRLIWPSTKKSAPDEKRPGAKPMPVTERPRRR